MPRKKASKDPQSPEIHQPTLAGFINSKSASMANPSAKPQPTAKATTTQRTSEATTSTTSKSPAKTTTPTKLKIGPPTSKRGSSRRRSDNKRKRTESPKKKPPARQRNPLGESDDDSDPGALQAIRFESQEEGTHTGGSTIELTSSSEDEGDEIISPARPKRTATQKRRASSGSDSDIEVIGGSAGAPRNGKRRLKRRLKSSDEEDPTETEDEGGPSPKKRRLVRGMKPSTSEEEVDLLDEVDEHRECHPRN